MIPHASRVDGIDFAAGGELAERRFGQVPIAATSAEETDLALDIKCIIAAILPHALCTMARIPVLPSDRIAPRSLPVNLVTQGRGSGKCGMPRRSGIQQLIELWLELLLIERALLPARPFLHQIKNAGPNQPKEHSRPTNLILSPARGATDLTRFFPVWRQKIHHGFLIMNGVAMRRRPQEHLEFVACSEHS